MSRLHADLVEVRTRPEPAGPVPDQFWWRGRLYLVREVLARWTESGSWWRGRGIRALLSGGEAVALDDREPVVFDVQEPVVFDDQERLWWRVEADSGRLAALSGGPGTYDLCFTVAEGSWSLVRVMD